MHFEQAVSGRIRKTKEGHRDFVRGEPNSRTESRAGTVGVSAFRPWVRPDLCVARLDSA